MDESATLVASWQMNILNLIDTWTNVGFQIMHKHKLNGAHFKTMEGSHSMKRGMLLWISIEVAP